MAPPPTLAAGSALLERGGVRLRWLACDSDRPGPGLAGREGGRVDSGKVFLLPLSWPDAIEF
jgi:hypothetical protein